jgi:hypothetical protein
MTTELTSSQREDLISAFDDHSVFCREALQIRNTTGSSVPMELSPGQVKLDAAIKKQQARRQPVRLVVLKTRRSQFTAGACSEIFHEVAFFAGRRATIIADKYNPAGLEAFDYLVQYDLSYKPIVRHGHGMQKPRLTKPTKPQSPVPEGSSLQLLWENGASVDVLSAEGGDVGRGGGRHWLLGDEVAFWRAATVTLTAVLNMIPNSPETGVILQSTANGVGGEFYNLCQKARDPNNEGGWDFLFFGWLEHPPYQMPLTDAGKAKLQASLDPEEKLLMSMHGATLEQLAWRRHQVHTELRGDVDLFHQEFPTPRKRRFLRAGARYSITATSRGTQS